MAAATDVAAGGRGTVTASGTASGHWQRNEASGGRTGDGPGDRDFQLQLCSRAAFVINANGSARRRAV